MIEVALLGALIVCAASALLFWLRARWIHKKLLALQAPHSAFYAGANAQTPSKGPRRRVVLIGDSRISQWPQGAWSQEWEILNRGIGGETLGQLSQRFQSDALALSPDVIVIESGVNDLVAASFLSEDETNAAVLAASERLVQLAEAAVASGAVVLVGTIIPPARPSLLRLLVHKKIVYAMAAALNARLRGSRWPPPARLLDLSRILGADDAALPAIYRGDTLHLNRLGYKRLTLAVEDMLRNVSAEGVNR